jgi:uncharacterized protein
MSEPTRCYAVEAVYAADAADRRQPHRQAHLERVAQLADAGVIGLAGAYADLSASLLVLNVDSEEAAVELVRSDVYWRESVWTDFTVRALNRVA